MSRKGNIYIKKDLNVGFIPIPKNGSSTIRKVFFGWHPEKHGAVFNFIESPEVLDKAKVTTIVSNPLVRFARGITEVLERPENRKTIRTPIFNNCPTDECKVNAVIDQIEKIGFYDTHLRPQWDFISDEEGNMTKVDEFWLLEDLTKKVKELNPSYKGEKAWSKGNKKDRFLKVIRGSKELRQRVIDLYRKDVDLYLEITGEEELR